MRAGDVEGGFGGFDLPDGRPCGRMFRREERTAVLVRDDRDLECPDSRRLVGDLRLSIPMRGRRIGIVAAASIVVRFESVCEGDLPERFARHERLRVRLVRDLLGDPDHEAAVDDDAGGDRARTSRRLTGCAERNQVEPRMILRPGQNLGQLPRLSLGRLGEDRIGVEMDQDGLTAAPHHPVRRDGGVDPA